MTKAEKLVEEIIAECQKNGEPVTLADAIEMAKMELGAKEIKNYTQSTPEKKKGKREIKPDEEKIEIIDLLNYCLMNIEVVDSNATITIADVYVKNKQREILFNVGENEYSLILTKHRKK